MIWICVILWILHILKGKQIPGFCGNVVPWGNRETFFWYEHLLSVLSEAFCTVVWKVVASHWDIRWMLGQVTAGYQCVCIGTNWYHFQLHTRVFALFLAGLCWLSFLEELKRFKYLFPRRIQSSPSSSLQNPTQVKHNRDTISIYLAEFHWKMLWWTSPFNHRILLNWMFCSSGYEEIQSLLSSTNKSDVLCGWLHIGCTMNNIELFYLETWHKKFQSLRTCNLGLVSFLCLNWKVSFRLF